MSIDWIPVKSCKPLMDCVVAVVISDGATTVWCKAFYSQAEGFQAVCQALDGEVTHWALVELP